MKAKAGGRQYGKNFIQLVVVDDYEHFRTKSDHSKPDVSVTNELLCPDLDFARLPESLAHKKYSRKMFHQCALYPELIDRVWPGIARPEPFPTSPPVGQAAQESSSRRV